MKLRDVRIEQLIRTLTEHIGEVRSIAFSPNGKILASASADKTLKLWKVK